MDMLFGQENDALIYGANSVYIEKISITILQIFASFEAHGLFKLQALL